MSFFLDNNYVHHEKQTRETNNILYELYEELIKANKYLNKIKRGGEFDYGMNIQKITNVSQISKPKFFNSNSFPERVRRHIDDKALLEYSYTFSLFSREIKIIFIIEEAGNIKEYNKYVDAIIMWLYMLNMYASNKCSKKITIYLYFTKLEKKLPSSNISILDQHNVNTAFTRTCPKDSEIVVFRKEEWFKVLIHETFHNFGLDFSDMNNTSCHNYILSLFPVNSEVNLYEAYTEFWAEIINSLFCSFFILKNKNDINEFMKNVEYFINFERTYSFFQLVKTLNFMGLTYNDLYSKSSKSSIMRDNLYKEDSNVLSYYIIKTILINNYQDFIYWCKKHNSSLLQFKKTTTSQTDLCKFIEKKYRTKQMLQNVKSTELFMKRFKESNNTNKIDEIYYLLTNMRMSICELG
jgi:hypothetical protein